MKILNSDIAFSALLGKKEVMYTRKGNSTLVHTLQYVYPFKDEFVTKADKEKWVEEFKKTPFYQKQNTSTNDMQKRYDIVVEPALSFTKEQMCYAKSHPDSSRASMNARLFLNSDNYCTTVTRNYGEYPVAMFDGQVFDCIV